VAVVAVVAVAVAAVVGSGDETEPDGDGAGGSGDAEPATEAQLDAMVAEISDFVAEERGLEFREPVEVELEDDAGFEARLLEDFDEDAEDMADLQVMYKALGLLGPDDDLMAQLEEAYGVGVVGFYDPETDELVVRGTALTPSVRITIAHELVHALDDQHFDLDRTEYDERDDEIGYGFAALVEGQATLVEEEYLYSLSDEEQDQYLDEMLDQVGGGVPDVPDVLLEVISSPYVDGPPFVDELWLASGEEGVNAAYRDPPRTSEQVLRPDAYLDREAPVDVPHPSPDGALVEEGVLGQLMIELTLAQVVDPQQAETAATGWGGDWAVAWQEGERSCMRAVVVGDTAADSDELHDAWSAWSDEVPLTATVQQGDPGGPTTVTACA
jgi:hypothetical protein